MEHLLHALVTPPLRCFHVVGSSRYQICGAVACWQRPGAHWFDVRYFCDAHRRPGDQAIAGELAARVVQFTADVLLSGASMQPNFAQVEALARLEAAVDAVGGVLNVAKMDSRVVRYACQPAPARENAIALVGR